jgi:large subunit ribosomal protein L24
MTVKVRIRKGDNVIIIAGKDKGKSGVVSERVDVNRLLVSGINMVKKHIKPNPKVQQEGGVVSKEASIHISNVMILNPVTQKRDRIKFKIIEQDGTNKKVRCFASSGERIDA